MDENQIDHIARIKKKQELKRAISKVWRFLPDVEPRSIVLNYHSVHPLHCFSTKPADFQKQIELLQSRFDIVGLSDYVSGALKGGNYAVITFDDGYEDNYEHAFPILDKLGVKATVFVTTGFVNGEIDIAQDHIAYRGLKPLSWEQIKRMSKSGISFGAHTHTHRILADISLKDAEQEISKSKKILESRLGQSVDTFAYPLGQRGTFNAQIVELLKKHHFKLACSTIWGGDNGGVDVFALRRIRIDAGDTIEDFKDKVSGAWDFIRFFQMVRW